MNVLKSREPLRDLLEKPSFSYFLLLPPHQHQQMSLWKQTFVFDRFLLTAKRQVVE